MGENRLNLFNKYIHKKESVPPAKAYIIDDKEPNIKPIRIILAIETIKASLGMSKYKIIKIIRLASPNLMPGIPKPKGIRVSI